MNNLDKQYLNLLQDILDNGVTKKDRTGVGTKSVFGRQIRHKMSEGFPILTTKKIFWKGVVEELLWFLRGETNIQPLIKAGVNIWTGDAYKAYLKYMEEEEPELIVLTKDEFSDIIEFSSNYFGELGPIYGFQWRKFGEIIETDIFGSNRVVIPGIDQIQNLINDLNSNPDSRRLMVTAWNPADVDLAVLPPCHYGFQCWTRELTAEERWDYYYQEYGPRVPKRAISLSWNQRSVDTFLGLGFNISSYGLLLCILADMVNMVPDELIGNLGDTHLYLNHIDAVKEQLQNQGFDLPSLTLNIKDKKFEDMKFEDFNLNDYKSNSTIKAKLNN